MNVKFIFIRSRSGSWQVSRVHLHHVKKVLTKGSKEFKISKTWCLSLLMPFNFSCVWMYLWVFPEKNFTYAPCHISKPFNIKKIQKYLYMCSILLIFLIKMLNFLPSVNSFLSNFSINMYIYYRYKILVTFTIFYIF